MLFSERITVAVTPVNRNKNPRRTNYDVRPRATWDACRTRSPVTTVYRSYLFVFVIMTLYREKQKQNARVVVYTTKNKPISARRSRDDRAC